MSKLKYWYFYITVTIIIGGLSLMFYWAFIDGVYTNKVINKDYIVYKTDKTVYYPGDTVYVSTNGLCKYRDLSAESYLNLTDTISIPYEVKNRSINKGCLEDDRFIMFSVIPTFLPDGTYYFNGYHNYSINPIRQGDEGIQVHFETNKFQIMQHKIWID